MRRLLNFLPFRRRRMEAELDRELRYHLDRRAEDLERAGFSPAEARRRVMLEFGGMAQAREEVRDVWVWRWLSDLGQDARYAARVLAGSPGFTITAALSLALGIGANTAIFSILDALVLRSLPVAEPERLVVAARNNVVSAPYPWFVEIRDHARTFEGALAFRTNPMRLTKDGETERVTGALVSGTYFDVLGVRPPLGTAIEPEDDRVPNSGGWRGPVAVLSHGYWRRRFGGRADAIGARILLNGSPFTVVGVAPPRFTGTEVGEPADVFAPMMLQPVLLPGLGNSLGLPRSQWLRIIGRLRRGVDPRASEAELTTLLRQYNQEIIRAGDIQDPGRRRSLLEQRITLLPGNAGISQLRRQYSQPLWVLISVVLMVVLIACANIGSLLVSRATARRREIAIRLSLGAARSRLARQLFTESLLLAVAGAGAGLVLAGWMRNLLIRYLPDPRSLDVSMDGSVLLFTLAVGVGAALVFGLVPAFQSANIDVAAAIKGGDATARITRVLLRKGLVVGQMSVSFLLLVGAALFLRSLDNLTAIDPGFARERTLVASVESGPGLDARLLESMKRLPGVVSAALADSAPLDFNTGWSIYVPGFVPGPNEPRDSPSVGFVSPGYFATMGIPLLAGRDLDEHDIAGRRQVMVVNQTFARHFFAAENPVGRMVGTREGVYDWEIVGVVKDAKYTGLREGATRMVYVPARPGPWSSRTVVHLRVAGSLTGLSAAVRQKVHELDEAATVYNVHTDQEQVDQSLLRERLVGTITALFGGLALVLAAVGLYGLASYSVARRTREFGIRMAVGAETGSIVRLVTREALRLFAVGAAIGLAAAWALGQVVRNLLFGVEPRDIKSAVLAAAVLFAATMAAVWIPARRASRVDPMRALRCD